MHILLDADHKIWPYVFWVFVGIFSIIILAGGISG
ncbi:hypothetical protein ACUXCC_005584 [Cytobacillus horneckiae]